MQELEKVKERFLHSVKGTFSLPVSDSLENIKKLLSTQLSRDQREIVNSLDEKISSLHKNTQNIACLSDIRRDSFKVYAQPFSLMNTFEKIARSFQKAADLAQVQLLTFIDPNAPTKVLSDEGHIIKVMENLIENAIGYTQPGGSVYIDLKTKQLDDMQTRLSVSITDSGVGINRGQLKNYIQPFSGSGTEALGIGLSTALEILKAMGSQLKIASELNKGSRFSFSLDLQSSNEIAFDAHPDIKIGVLIDDRELFSYTKLLYQYIISMGFAVVSLKDGDDENIEGCHGVFFITNSCDTSKLEALSQRYEDICFIPTVLASRAEACAPLAKIEKLMLLPAMPSNINKSLRYIESKLPQEITDANENDHQTIQEIAKKAELEKVKILVVEDNPINLKLIKVVLERYNFEIDSTDNGRDAINMCRNERYNMVLMDIEMPVMDGITATKYIKEYEDKAALSQTPIVALTSHDLADERSEIMASGLDEHMAKPLNITRLELMLEHYLGFKPEKIK